MAVSSNLLGPLASGGSEIMAKFGLALKALESSAKAMFQFYGPYMCKKKDVCVPSELDLRRGLDDEKMVSNRIFEKEEEEERN